MTDVKTIPFETLVRATQEVVDALIELWERIKTLICAVGEALREYLKRIKPHLFPLAFKNKKYRTRKKNVRRIFKELFKFWEKVGNKNR